MIAQIWPICGALFFSGTFFVLAFPFFTFIPSSGAFRQDLPKVRQSHLPEVLASASSLRKMPPHRPLFAQRMPLQANLRLY